jgi:hypothetical protein
MKEGVTICFRTNGELRGVLEKTAHEDRRSLSSAIELIFKDCLKKNHDFPDQKKRRLFLRKQVGVDNPPM